MSGFWWAWRRRGASVTYLLSDTFTTAFAAQAGTATRTCEPVGTLTKVDTNGVMTGSAGRFVINGTVAANDRLVSPSAYARKAGRVFAFSVPTRSSVGTGHRAGFDANATGSTIDIGIDFSSTTAFRIKAGTGVIDTITLGSGEWRFVCLMHTVGGLLLARSGTSGPYTLYWSYSGGSASAFARIIATAGSVLSLTMDDWMVADLSGAAASDYGLATSRAATSTANQVIAAPAGCLVEHTFTAQTGVTKRLRVRYVDADNHWIVECNQAASTLSIIKREAGVETTLTTDAGTTWTNGLSYRVLVRCDGTTLTPYVEQGTSVSKKTAYASATFQQTATQASVDHSGTNLIAWPLTHTLAV